MESGTRAITFFAWSDTHFGYDPKFGPADFRWDIVRQMNNLAGWPYPPEAGGCVEKPAFVMHCGDMVDGAGTYSAAELALYRYFLGRLRLTHYETLGNHDIARDFRTYFRGKHGADSYAFDLGGIHFISLSGKYDTREVGTIPAAQMRFLKQDLGAVGKTTPIILFTHSRLDRVTNGAGVLRMLKRKHTLLVVSGHLHRPAVFECRGVPGSDVGHCRNHPIDPECGRSFTVVRIKGDTLTAIPWRWDLKDWEKGQRQVRYPDIHCVAMLNRRF